MSEEYTGPYYALGYHAAIQIFSGVKYPRKMKKKIIGTRRQYRRQQLAAIRARNHPIKITITLYEMKIGHE